MAARKQPTTSPPRGELGPTMAVESFEHAPVAMEVIDLEGRFLASMPAMAELTGYSREELIGSPTALLTHPDHALRDDELRGSLLRRRRGSVHDRETHRPRRRALAGGRGPRLAGTRG